MSRSTSRLSAPANAAQNPFAQPVAPVSPVTIRSAPSTLARSMIGAAFVGTGKCPFDRGRSFCRPSRCPGRHDRHAAVEMLTSRPPPRSAGDILAGASALEPVQDADPRAGARRCEHLRVAHCLCATRTTKAEAIVEKMWVGPGLMPAPGSSLGGLKRSQAAKVTNCGTRERIHFLSSFKERGGARWHRRALLHRLVAAKRRSTAAGSSKSATANVNQRRTSWSPAPSSVAKWITGQAR